MLFKTRGIVLNYIKYKESSIIAKIYTEEFGLQSYIENGVRSPKSHGKIALFQPLTLLDLVVYNNKTKDIQRISELKCSRPFYNIPTDIKKSALAIFVSEVLNLSLKEHSENNQMFDFLFDSLNFLEDHEEQIENFHLFFLLNLSAYLGFEPQNVRDISNRIREQDVILKKESEDILNKLIQTPFGENLNITKAQRLDCLDILLDFYRLNLDNFGTLKSLSVLKDVLEWKIFF